MKPINIEYRPVEIIDKLNKSSCQDSELIVGLNLLYDSCSIDIGWGGDAINGFDWSLFSFAQYPNEIGICNGELGHENLFSQEYIGNAQRPNVNILELWNEATNTIQWRKVAA